MLTDNSLYIRAIDSFRPATTDELIASALKALSFKIRRGATLKAPEETFEYLRLKMGPLTHEVFFVIFLNARHRIIEYREMFRGTVNGASVYPREVVKEALALNASAIIVGHNHPSGCAEPSVADEMITQRLRNALELVDVRLVDHLVICGDTVVSLAARGLV